MSSFRGRVVARHDGGWLVSPIVGRRVACPLGRACGCAQLTGFFGAMDSGSADTLLAVPEACGGFAQAPRPGDEWVLGASAGALLRGVALVYGLPLLGLFAGGGLAALVGVGDAGVGVGVLSGLGLTLLVGRRLDRDLVVEILSPVRPEATLDSRGML